MIYYIVQIIYLLQLLVAVFKLFHIRGNYIKYIVNRKWASKKGESTIGCQGPLDYQYNVGEEKNLNDFPDKERFIGAFQ